MTPARSSAHTTPPPPSITSVGEESTYSVRTANGQIKETWENSRGKLHRIGAPAAIDRTKSGVPFQVRYYEDGYMHRVGGPAKVVLQDGLVVRAVWKRRGQFHRIDGPAADESRKRFYVDGIEHADLPTALKAFVQNNGEQTIRREIRATPFADFEIEGADPYRILDGLAAGIRTPAGMKEYLDGAPPEWVRAYEESRSVEVRAVEQGGVFVEDRAES